MRASRFHLGKGELEPSKRPGRPSKPSYQLKPFDQRRGKLAVQTNTLDGMQEMSPKSWRLEEQAPGGVKPSNVRFSNLDRRCCHSREPEKAKPRIVWGFVRDRAGCWVIIRVFASISARLQSGGLRLPCGG